MCNQTSEPCETRIPACGLVLVVSQVLDEINVGNLTSWVPITKARTESSPNQSGQMHPEPVKFYKGRDLHAYTPDHQHRLPLYVAHFQSRFPEKNNRLDPGTFSLLLDQIRDALRIPGLYSGTIETCLQNLRSHYRAPEETIDSPELPGLNFALILLALFRAVENSGNLGPFAETLSEIGNTCLAGITDRLLALYTAVCDL